MNKQGSPFLENAVTKIQERRGDLANRQKNLREKITAMERAIPALMAFNMWKSGKECDEPPLCKIRQIMKKISPNTDPAEKLVDNLKRTVNTLNMETAELHDKIIAADIKLEESQMQLESLELENKEFDDALKKLEKEVNRKETPSLHSIHSEDLSCLAKIRQLGEEEINLKNSIRELEERETIFQEHINRILASREFQKSMSNDPAKRGKIHSCLMHIPLGSVQEIKKKIACEGKQAATSSKEKYCGDGSAHKVQDSNSAETSCVGTTAGRARGEKGVKEKSSKICDLSSCPGASKASTSGGVHCPWKVLPSRNAGYQQSSQLSGSFPKPCCSVHNTKSNSSSTGRGCPACCAKASSPVKSKCKLANASKSSQWKCCREKAGCQLTQFGKPAPGSMCKKCQGWIPHCEDQISRPAFACKGKCAVHRSNLPCNCSAYLESLDDKELRQGGESAASNEQSSTDDEFCECCDCGCNDSDLSTDSC